ncbi:MAG: serine/threonine protein kinase [Chloroflexi bacterium]|nr:serine/threonine protein kinase [Chloroflexota bacterium]
MENLSGQQLGEYQLLERIGRGGMSAVYRAVRGPNEPDVAVKVMDTNPDTVHIFLQRFEQEAQIVKELKHPHILPLLAFGQDRGYPYMVTPLVRGGTLADILRVRVLSAEDAGGWLYQIAMALDQAHDHGVVHRDLKPTNILLDERGHAYLTDFGIAKLLNITGSLTVTGNVIGTPTYMAPEQWRGESATRWTDVYGLGVLVYIMLAGKPPFQADSPHSLMYKHLNEPPPSIQNFNASVPDAIDEVVIKALGKDQRQRYPSAGEFSHDFQRALRGLETYAQRYPPSYPRRHRTPVNAFLPKQDVYIPSSYQPPPQAYPAGTSQPYNPNVLQNVQVKRRRLSLRSIVLLVLIVVVVSAFGYSVSQDPDRWLPQEQQAISLPTIPPVTPTQTAAPGSRPTISILFPQDGSVFPVDEEFVIRFNAQDTVGITRIEIRRFGYVFDSLENINGETNYAAQVTYTPRQPGRHIIEITPYRGAVRGESAILEVQAQ